MAPGEDTGQERKANLEKKSRKREEGEEGGAVRVA